MEIYELLQRYTKDSEGKDITLAELQSIAWWRCVWGHWMAKAYYQIDGFYQRLEDVPEGLEDYHIVDEVYTKYWTERGVLKSQVLTKEDCKRIYG
ncbi:MAG: hypothetical protein JWM44_3514 [Bacilli bacterium]|nr:hypothetical protein [Bacilli bacterium]